MEEDNNRDSKGKFKKGNVMQLGNLNSNPHRSHIALRQSMYKFMETISQEEITRYFSMVPDHNKFQVYATMLDLQHKWGNADLKLDMEALKIQLQHDTKEEEDNIIDVSFIEDDEE